MASEIRHSRRHCSVCDERKISIRSLYLKGYTLHSKVVDRRISLENWTKRGVNKLFKTLRDTGTVERRQCSGRPHSARTEENARLLLQKFSQSVTDFVLLIVR